MYDEKLHYSYLQLLLSKTKNKDLKIYLALNKKFILVDTTIWWRFEEIENKIFWLQYQEAIY